MANITNPADMVAADQLFKAMLQRVSVAISDKQDERAKITCISPQYYHINTGCENCPHASNCVSKSQFEKVNSDIQSLTEERTQLMQKYSELQDTIKNYLMS